MRTRVPIPLYAVGLRGGPRRQSVVNYYSDAESPTAAVLGMLASERERERERERESQREGERDGVWPGS